MSYSSYIQNTQLEISQFALRHCYKDDRKSQVKVPAVIRKYQLLLHCSDWTGSLITPPLSSWNPQARESRIQTLDFTRVFLLFLSGNKCPQCLTTPLPSLGREWKRLTAKSVRKALRLESGLSQVP
eukprot:g48549.t1